MLASGHFQDAIEPPSAIDIVILILWSRLGTPLPEKTAVREYRGIDDRAPVTGTEWEYEDALRAAQRARRARHPGLPQHQSRARSTRATSRRSAASLAQLNALNEFWKRHFADRGVFLAAYDEYRTIERIRAAARGIAAQADRAAHQDARRRPAAISRRSGSRRRSAASNPTNSSTRRSIFGRDALVAQGIEQLAARRARGNRFPAGFGRQRLGQIVAGQGGDRAAADEAAAHRGRRLCAPAGVTAPSDGGGDVVLGPGRGADARRGRRRRRLARAAGARPDARRLGGSICAPRPTGRASSSSGALGRVDARRRAARAEFFSRSRTRSSFSSSISSKSCSPSRPSATRIGGCSCGCSPASRVRAMSGSLRRCAPISGTAPPRCPSSWRCAKATGGSTWRRPRRRKWPK